MRGRGNYSDARLVKINRVPLIRAIHTCDILWQNTQEENTAFQNNLHTEYTRARKRERERIILIFRFSFSFFFVQRCRRLKSGHRDEPFRFSSFVYSLVKLCAKVERPVESQWKGSTGDGSTSTNRMHTKTEKIYSFWRKHIWVD